MKLVIVIYNNNHGTDAFPILLQDDEDDTKALSILREEMVAEYGEEDVKRDEEQYGGFQLGCTIVDGTSYTRGNKCVSISFTEEKEVERRLGREG